MTKPHDEIISNASEREDYSLQSTDKNSCTFGGRKASSSSSDDVKLCFNLKDEKGLQTFLFCEQNCISKG